MIFLRIYDGSNIEDFLLVKSTDVPVILIITICLVILYIKIRKQGQSKNLESKTCLTRRKHSI